MVNFYSKFNICRYGKNLGHKQTTWQTFPYLPVQSCKTFLVDCPHHRNCYHGNRNIYFLTNDLLIFFLILILINHNLLQKNSIFSSTFCDIEWWNLSYLNWWLGINSFEKAKFKPVIFMKKWIHLTAQLHYAYLMISLTQVLDKLRIWHWGF